MKDLSKKLEAILFKYKEIELVRGKTEYRNL